MISMLISTCWETNQQAFFFIPPYDYRKHRFFHKVAAPINAKIQMVNPKIESP